MRWLRLVGYLKLQVSFAKEPYKRDNILQKRPVILRSLPIVATPPSCNVQLKKLNYKCSTDFAIRKKCDDETMKGTAKAMYLSKETNIRQKRRAKETY